MTERTRVAVIGAGPAGLLLSQLLHERGVDHVVLESRSREEIHTTHRAGILEAGSVRALVELGLDRVIREGDRHDGIDLRFDGEMHRIDFRELVGESVWLYPQTEVFADLAARRTEQGADIRWQTSVVEILDHDGANPGVRWRDAEGREGELRAELLVGADGSRSIARHAFPEQLRRTWVHEYPYAWFGVIVEAPRSAPELVYAESERGFALVSQRTPTHQRLYFQCDPDEDPDAWDDARIWTELQARVAGPDGFRLAEGPVEEKTVLRFRSSVVEPVRHGRLVLAGDAAHTVPPTGAKGLNLALADVLILAEVLEGWLAGAGDDALDEYGRRSSRRVWRAQNFSAWMSRMLHTTPDEPGFERRRRIAELRTLVESEAGRRYLAEGYTGWENVR
ncbi:4-hydroxybenzoate 3-monooxygenase [Protaetiibacter intestinalis]|uniref:4-hydroxybenzoate 3-monooxygenase n=1 Tax=Protaetiibacter intestinalis TaxID=2419774 RepID=A0A387B3M6_9MICO|nr:4-hydroxybenzoate 3-monooxygenase [Protaetiibacter intestinalis]AYF98224.1 4-hydroxybenzoate 3-monooxygenase [Protaetiibacter intestinalis]